MKCKVEGCDKPQRKSGLCWMHRKRLSRHGHLEQTRPADWGQREKHPLYQTWLSMLRRCSDQKHPDFKRYGARGIRVCKHWREDFWAFVSDMGLRPTPSHQLDRERNSRGYSPKNCHWATPVEQARNRRSRVLTSKVVDEIQERYFQKGERQAEIARSLGVSASNVYHVLARESWND